MTAVAHPAKFSAPVLDAANHLLAARIAPQARVLDPFAGIGLIHRLGAQYDTVGVELEPEWAAAHPRTIVGDSRHLPFPDATFDAIVTSPAYGNRMADRYAGDAKGSTRHTYRIALGRPLSDGNGAGLQWGQEYRDLHAAVWTDCERVLKPGGWMLVNVSNHIRKGLEQRVVEWHTRTLLALGLFIDAVIPVGTRRMRYGENHEARVAAERILVLRKP